MSACLLPRTWKLLREAVGVLLEGTPYDVNLAAVRDAIKLLPEVEDVHDLHVWTITSGMNAMSVHVVVDDKSARERVLSTIHDSVTQKFNIAHVTVQIEAEGWRKCELHL